MTTLLENPLPTAVVGGLATLLALLVFLSRRSLASLGVLIGAVAVTLLLLAVERLVATPRERVEAALVQLLDAIEANDVSGALAVVDSQATKLRSDMQALMPQIKVEAANASGVEVTVDDAAEPHEATARFRAYLHGIHERSGAAVAYINQQVDLHWVERDGQWYVDDYTAYYDGQPIDAVGSAADNRAIPAR